MKKSINLDTRIVSLPIREPIQEATVPLAFITQRARWKVLNLGQMNVICDFCNAKHWFNERASGSTTTRSVFEHCCKKGAVQLPILSAPPEPLQSLMKNQDSISRTFRTKIRQYNSALSFTSVKYQADTRTANSGPGVQCFQIHGELYHLQGPLESAPNTTPQFAQLFLYDPQYAASMRHTLHPDLDLHLLEQLTLMLHECNPFIEIYQTAKERLNAASINADSGITRIVLNPQLQLIVESGADKRRCNLPTSNEVAMIIGDEYAESGFRDIILASRNNDNRPHFSTINGNHASYMPLHYVLLFPRGELGYHWALQLQDNGGQRRNTRLAQRAFYRYRLHPRIGESDILFCGQRLWQQFLVDAWAVCDQNKLQWLRHHQANIRSDLYNGLADAMVRDEIDASAIGKRTILPSSYTGGDRFMQQLFQDSMAIVRHFGRPTLFIIFTANPKWEEIVQELLPGQSAIDRPDLVARVFHIKQKQLLHEIKHDNIFGRFAGCVWTIEYQKRGLPHMHLLLFLHSDDRFLTAEAIDKIVCAELPDQATDPNGELLALIKTTMIHGPCGWKKPQAPCMISSGPGLSAKCSKRFPKDFQEETVVQDDGYPLYRRRNNGQTFDIPIQINGAPASFQFDNRWIVPYNPYLTWKYKAHINVEVCASVHAVKYIHKYIYKGSDRTTLQIAAEQDEIQRYLQGRYIGPTEAVWRLFEFAMHEELPTVKHLAVHLPGEQPVYFPDNATSDQLQSRMDLAKTTLLAFFEYNSLHEDGRHYLYQDFPTSFVFQEKQHVWTPRKRGTAIGRMYHCNPFMGEKYYLRLLLTIVPGAKSFEHLRTVRGIIYTTFREACSALGLLEDNQEWITCFQEAVTFTTGQSLRTLSTTAFLFGSICNPLELWNKFKDYICDDLKYRLEQQNLIHLGASIADAHIDYGLYLISQILADSNKTLMQFEIPSPTIIWHHNNGNPLLAEEYNYNTELQAVLYNSLFAQMNIQQRYCFNTIIAALDQPQTAQFFLQGPAGTGKTFLYRALCSYIRQQGKIVPCVASSGIAAQLLPGGRTSHSRFKIPLHLNESSICSISSNSQLAELIRSTALIIWDEVPMQHKYCFEAVNRTLNDICHASDNDLFGNIPIVFGGDFAQILPVVPRGNRAAIVRACIQQSFLWPRFKLLYLTENMRVISGSANMEFAQFPSTMSYLPALRGMIELPNGIESFCTMQHFCQAIFPNDLLAASCNDYTLLGDRTILAFRNDTVTEFNHELISQFPGQVHYFDAVNSADINDAISETEELPMEYLQSINHPSLPPSKLILKLGAPVILPRNINPGEGLCNGTRMTIIQLSRTCIGVRILGGDFDGHCKLLPRIVLSTNEGELPFILKRKQFPIRLCFAMTVNKSQGQSFKMVGIDLRTPAFCHGQLYVALSRVTSLNGLKVLFAPRTSLKTDNIVYPEVLLSS